MSISGFRSNRRNWRLRKPDDRGPGRVKVLSLEPHRTKIRFVRRDIDLDVAVAASASQSGSDGREPDASHPTRIDFKGEIGGTEFSGEVLAGALLTFLETGESFPMSGHASAGTSRLDVDGTVADLFNPSAIDAKVRSESADFSDFGSLAGGSHSPEKAAGRHAGKEKAAPDDAGPAAKDSPDNPKPGAPKRLFPSISAWPAAMSWDCSPSTAGRSRRHRTRAWN